MKHARSLPAAIALSRSEKKKITGGIITPYKPGYVCGADGECFGSLYACRLYCGGNSCITVDFSFC
jgi:hypothetical protein